ncbi:hypothetical protein BKA63DRAFT_503487 [Paraphoma chrysanthemicola]|nr:hypothetical protein BKA63DRAFT_503487 [Paraphoma chrysanthemicola]
METEISSLKVRPILSRYGKTPLHAIHLEPSCVSDLRQEDDLPNNPPSRKAPLKSPLVSPSPDESAQPKSVTFAESHGQTESRTTTEKEDRRWVPPLTVYLPYLAWMKYSRFRQHEDSRTEGDKKEGNSKTFWSYSRSQDQIRKTFSRPPYMEKMPELNSQQEDCHRRRTLDQYYYPALKDTKDRDSDQTISKWTGLVSPADGGGEPAEDSLLLMVDQLWCWILDDETIITSFPWEKEELPDYQSLYGSIIRHISTCRSVWEMQSLFVEHAMGYLFSQRNRNFCDIVETYNWVISKKAADQTESFQRFHKRYADGEYNLKTFDDRDDMKLMLEVADIIDELKMIRHVLDTQGKVLMQMTQTLSQIGMWQLSEETPNKYEAKFDADRLFEIAGRLSEGRGAKYLNRACNTLAQWHSETSSIMEDAQATHKTALDLLDLKSKLASLAEARATTKQGQAVMLFTVVTIIFLPLSFFTSYFGQNVSEITGDTSNPTTWQLWRTATPISIVVIVTALLVAYYITVPDSKLWLWQAPYEHGESEMLRRIAARQEAKEKENESEQVEWKKQVKAVKKKKEQTAKNDGGQGMV